jgi:hypothetical protein
MPATVDTKPGPEQPGLQWVTMTQMVTVTDTLPPVLPHKKQY